MGVPEHPPHTMTQAKWEFDNGALHSTIKRTKTHPPESPAVPEKAHDRGQRVSFSDIGGLLRSGESPGRNQWSGGSDSASGSASGSGSGSASGSGSYDSVVKVPPDEMMFNDVGGLLTVFEEV